MLAHIARRIGPVSPDRAVLIAVDGVDGAGKTIFAQALVAHLERSGQRAIGVSIDGFHRPRVERYRRGRSSPEGFYRDSYDVEAFHAAVVAPTRPGGSMRVRPAVFDHATDSAVHPEEIDVAGAVVVVDGIFLRTVTDAWDLSVFLDVPFAETYARMAERDGCPPAPEHPENARYLEGQRLYLAEHDPAARADVLVDNTDPQRPVVVRGG